MPVPAITVSGWLLEDEDEEEAITDEDEDEEDDEDDEDAAELPAAEELAVPPLVQEARSREAARTKAKDSLFDDFIEF